MPTVKALYLFSFISFHFPLWVRLLLPLSFAVQAVRRKIQRDSQKIIILDFIIWDMDVQSEKIYRNTTESFEKKISETTTHSNTETTTESTTETMKPSQIVVHLSIVFLYICIYTYICKKKRKVWGFGREPGGRADGLSSIEGARYEIKGRKYEPESKEEKQKEEREREREREKGAGRERCSTFPSVHIYIYIYILIYSTFPWNRKREEQSVSLSLSSSLSLSLSLSLCHDYNSLPHPALYILR